MTDLCLSYFRDILGINHTPVLESDWGILYPNLQPHLSSPSNPLSEDETLMAIKSLGRDKAPGPDGLTPKFFLKTWDIVGLDFCKSLEHLLFGSGDWSRINKAFIALIPKTEGATELSEFRPISLTWGFPEVWAKWIELSLRSSESAVLLNGKPGKWFRHRRAETERPVVAIRFSTGGRYFCKNDGKGECSRACKRERLQTKDIIIKHGGTDVEPHCIFCKEENESVKHLLAACRIIQTSWDVFLGKMGMRWFLLIPSSDREIENWSAM
ncbi:hypothetical protein Cni_G05587 [Canna indica]|uniref:Reverse transcriptase zinc-binding domain-containing protein n=1 Tax=Canna indica TaxID=4628 RepID=A0AAQ3Q5M8_9LILI|nr:hypothetical protein Cni_G05587 [Canna indica]